MVNLTAMQNGFLRRHLKALFIVTVLLMALSVPLRVMAQAAIGSPTPTGTPRNPQTNLEATPTPTPTVDKIQYLEPGSDWVDVTDDLYVLRDTTVSFRALPSPSDATFPSDKPQWGGTSGATGTGATTSVTFSALSPGLTVTASCGNTATANVIVYEMEPVFAPVDDFPDRSYEDFGVGEDINLSVKIRTSATSSTSVPATKLGGVDFVIENGDGSLPSSSSGDGTGLYTVGTSEGVFSLAARLKQGPSKGKKRTKQAKQVQPFPDGRPTGANLVRETGTATWHKANSASAGFAGEIYLLPNNVSFSRVRMREGTCKSVATGFLAGANGNIHAAGPVLTVSNTHTPYGCKVNTIDTIGLYGPRACYALFRVLSRTFLWEYPKNVSLPNISETTPSAPQHGFRDKPMFLPRFLKRN